MITSTDIFKFMTNIQEVFNTKFAFAGAFAGCIVLYISIPILICMWILGFSFWSFMVGVGLSMFMVNLFLLFID